MDDDPFEMTADVNGKPIPRWQARLEGMYTDYVPFGEILGFVRHVIDSAHKQVARATQGGTAVTSADVLAELTRWGEKGYAVTLHYGLTWREEQKLMGWMCHILNRPMGSVAIGWLDPSPYGFHRTDPLAAARDALRQAGQRWSEMVVQS